MTEQTLRQPTGPCRHCGQATLEGEALVNWPWIHASGWYQCGLVGGGTLAEPVEADPS